MPNFPYAMVPYPPPSPPIRAATLPCDKTTGPLIKAEADCTAQPAPNGRLMFEGRVLKASCLSPDALAADWSV